MIANVPKNKTVKLSKSKFGAVKTDGTSKDEPTFVPESPEIDKQDHEPVKPSEKSDQFGLVTDGTRFTKQHEVRHQTKGN